MVISGKFNTKDVTKETKIKDSLLKTPYLVKNLKHSDTELIRIRSDLTSLEKPSKELKEIKVEKQESKSKNNSITPQKRKYSYGKFKDESPLPK
jgi:hypothetical protein